MRKVEIVEDVLLRQFLFFKRVWQGFVFGTTVVVVVLFVVGVLVGIFNNVVIRPSSLPKVLSCLVGIDGVLMCFVGLFMSTKLVIEVGVWGNLGYLSFTLAGLELLGHWLGFVYFGKVLNHYLLRRVFSRT